jgi:hypothetical protein
VSRCPRAARPASGDYHSRKSTALFDVCQSEHLFLFLMLAFGTLARLGALLDLPTEQFDLENG